MTADPASARRRRGAFLLAVLAVVVLSLVFVNDRAARKANAQAQKIAATWRTRLPQHSVDEYQVQPAMRLAQLGGGQKTAEINRDAVHVVKKVMVLWQERCVRGSLDRGAHVIVTVENNECGAR